MSFRLSVLIVAVTLLCSSARADDLTAEKRADIVRLLTITGSVAVAKQMGVQVADAFAKNLKRVRPDIPQEVISMLPGEVAAIFDENADFLIALMVPIYHRHLTAAEVRGMLDFYETSLGQKVLRLGPTLAQEGIVAGQQWSQALGPKLQERIKERLRAKGVAI